MEQDELPMNGEQAEATPKEEASENTGLSMEDLLEQGDLNLDLPQSGEVRMGMIASISDNEILVSIGAKSEGLIPSRELESMSDEERAKLKVGTEIPVYVVSPESNRGTLLLSYTRSLEEDDWENAEDLLKSKDTFDSDIEGFNKGGLIVRLGRLRGFVPASQVSQTRRMRYQGDSPEQRWGEMVGEPIVTRVIEVDRERRRLILSERAASQESREAIKEKLLDELAVGETRTGRVTSLADFGAFVNINGADGLVHLSELSWERVDHPKEMLSVGDEVQVKVISIDHDRKRIGLSLRQLQKDPWEDHIHEYRVGQMVEGTITRLVKFGAFARIDDHIEGLVHISELSEERIEHPKEVVSEGEQAVLRIIKIEPERRRIGLSLRKVDSAAYSDVDWEMALAEIEDGDGEVASDTEAAEAAEESADAEPMAEVDMDEAPEAEAEMDAEDSDEAEDADVAAEESDDEPEAEEAEHESDDDDGEADDNDESDDDDEDTDDDEDDDDEEDDDEDESDDDEDDDVEDED